MLVEPDIVVCFRICHNLNLNLTISQPHNEGTWNRMLKISEYFLNAVGVDAEIIEMGMVTWALEAAWVRARLLYHKPLCLCRRWRILW
jgi:hypothetical protein